MGKGNSRSSPRMTERKARTKARAKARAKAKARTEQKQRQKQGLVGFGEFGVDGRFWRGGDQIVPGGVGSLDEVDLLGASEGLELFLARDGASDITKIFEIDEAMDAVTSGVGAGVGLAMGVQAAGEGVGDADIEISRATGENVDPEMVLAAWHGEG